MAKIFLDPGHGGTESGATNNVALEKNLNLIVALETKRILELNNQIVGISRIADTTLGLTNRCKMANDFKADLFISIHHNANDGNSKDGEIYHSVNGGIGKELANKIAIEFNRIGQPARCLTRESKNYPGKDYYTVINNTNMPAIITEFGYMDNTKDYIQFNEPFELLMEGLAIAKGILAHLGIVNIITTKTEEPKEHWSEQFYQKLINDGFVVKEKRFDDNVTRGEMFCMIAQEKNYKS